MSNTNDSTRPVMMATSSEQRAMANFDAIARRSEWGERLARIMTHRLIAHCSGRPSRFDRTDPRRGMY